MTHYVTVAHLENYNIMLLFGTTFMQSDQYCFEEQNGEKTWEVDARNICMSTGIDVLFEGMTTILLLKVTSTHRSIKYVVVKAQNTVFVLNRFAINLLG